LMQRDIPLLKQLINIPFSSALAKGRGNYLCLNRLDKAINQQQEFLPTDDMMPEVKKIADWAGHTTDGSLSDLNFMPNNQLWSRLCSEPGTCTNDDDTAEKQCFFQKSRRKLYKADIIVANHAMVCVDLAMRRMNDLDQGILPDYQALIIDEAHTFEDVAATHLGIRITSYSAYILLGRLYNTRSHRGLLIRPGLLEARQAAIEAYEVTERFFSRLTQWLEAQDENPLTFKTPGHIPNLIDSTWSVLLKQLREINAMDDFDDEFKGEIRSIHGQLSDIKSQLHVFLNMSMEKSVYWFERYGSQQRYISMNVVPIEVNRILEDCLFNKEFNVVMTSATLAIDGDLDYFKSRIGATNSTSLILDSPFSIKDQVELYVPSIDMPEPSQSEFYLHAVCEHVKTFTLKTEGRAFVLFTSYSMMNLATDLLFDFYHENDIRLLVQGKDLSRTQMLDAFRSETRSVIFGTDSFWMGVDVPGDSLINVIIVKLPFLVPSHPLIAARKEHMEAQGKNSFFDYFLPEAVLKFRQGTGRLIRRKDDQGIIVVMDPRIMTKSYGRSFLSVFAECQRHVF
jgi:ATP-dependent DNA helicase DinG